MLGGVRALCRRGTLCRYALRVGIHNPQLATQVLPTLHAHFPSQYMLAVPSLEFHKLPFLATRAGAPVALAQRLPTRSTRPTPPSPRFFTPPLSNV